MKVFISWSGELSKELGEIFHGWLPSALQAVTPYFTPNDIDKGARWSSSIADELQNSEMGVFFLTPESLKSPWVMFEAGAISKVLGNTQVCPILFNLEPTDVSSPLSQFQLTKFTKGDIKKLFSVINKSCGNAMLDNDTEKKVFNNWWPVLEKEILSCLEKHKDIKAEEIRSDRDLMEEILSLSRQSSKQQQQYKRKSIRRVLPDKDSPAMVIMEAVNKMPASKQADVLQIVTSILEVEKIRDRFDISE